VGAWGEDAGTSIREECVRTSYVVMRWAGKEGRTVRVPVLPTCTSCSSRGGGNDCVRAPLDDNKGERGWGLNTEHLARATYGSTPLSLESPLC
jgi:hypothetical protein